MKEQSKKSRIITIVLSVIFLLPTFLGAIFDVALYKSSSYVVKDGIMDFSYHDINQKTDGIYVTG